MVLFSFSRLSCTKWNKEILIHLSLSMTVQNNRKSTGVNVKHNVYKNPLTLFIFIVSKIICDDVNMLSVINNS